MKAPFNPARAARHVAVLCAGLLFLAAGCVVNKPIALPVTPSTTLSAAPSVSPTGLASPTAPPTTKRKPEGAGDCPGAGSGALGVFRETSPTNVDGFESWLGCTVDVALDFSSRDTWEEISKPTYLIGAWKGDPRRLALSVAMLPLKDDRATIARGADGEYDKYFRELGRLLVAGGQRDAILRVGWEFNISGSRWLTLDAEQFVEYWRRIATVMGKVEGNRFAFDWNPNSGERRVDATRYYPGDDVVDVIGVDVYDVSSNHYPYPEECDAGCRADVQTSAWEQDIFGGERGLDFWRTFARQHDKPLSLPEWGLWRRRDGTGGGDDPAFIRRMHAFIVAPQSRIAYQAYFEFGAHGSDHRLMTTFKKTGKVYRQLFNKP